MKILIIHNQYKQKGGEDTVIESEKNLLIAKGHAVETLFFSNITLDTLIDKLKVAPQMWHNHHSAEVVAHKIRDFEPHIIHVHNLFNVASPAVLAVAHQKSVPVVMTLHNYRLLCVNGLFLRKGKICDICKNKTIAWQGIRHRCLGNSFVKSALLTAVIGWHKWRGTWQKYVAKYICLTNFSKQVFANSSLQLSENQIVVKPNFVEQQTVLPIAHRNNYFLFVGRLSPEKGVAVALEAAAIAQVPLHIIGEGELAPLVEKFARKHQQITYFGKRDKDFVIRSMQEAQALVLPSVWYEGMPMTILEAYSTGTPVIASAIPNIAEVVGEGLKDLLFEPYDAQGLAQKMLLWKKLDEPLIQNFYTQAQAMYQQHYSKERNYEQLITIYNQTIANYSTKKIWS